MEKECDIGEMVNDFKQLHNDGHAIYVCGSF
jgi:hypothetical protein